MAEVTSFKYGGFYDVPRCLSLRYRGRLFLLQSAFDEDLDEYPADYSIYIVPELSDNLRPVCSSEFLDTTPMACIGHIPIEQVVFDPSKREALDASCLDSLLAEQGL